MKIYEAGWEFFPAPANWAIAGFEAHGTGVGFRMLAVVKVRSSAPVGGVVKITYYVPISFRLFNDPIPGVRYIRLTASDRQLLELQFPPDSLMLTGFTVVSAEFLELSPLIGDGLSQTGIPEFELPPGRQFSGYRSNPRLELPISVQLSFNGGDAEVRIGGAERFNRKIVYGRVQFLLFENILTGLRVTDLTDHEKVLLFEYVARLKTC